MMRSCAPVVHSLLCAVLLVGASFAAHAGLSAGELRRVEPGAVASGVVAEAVVEATRQSTVAAQVAGRVIDLPVDAGQVVQRGQLLVRLDARESAEAAAAARAALTNARLNYERTQQLARQQYLSAAALDRARSELHAAQAQADAAQAGQSHAVLVAPFSGVVAQRHIEPGEMASPGRPLVTIFAPGGLRVAASVPQSRLAEVRRAKVAVVEFVESGTRVTSSAIHILPAADAATHALTVRVELPAGATTASAAGAPVPGMAARVHFAGDEVARVTVPEAAVVRRGAVTGVYVQAEGGRLSLRQVRLGERQANGEVEVLAGLVQGELVALDAIRAAIVLKQSAKERR